TSIAHCGLSASRQRETHWITPVVGANRRRDPEQNQPRHDKHRCRAFFPQSEGCRHQCCARRLGEVQAPRTTRDWLRLTRSIPATRGNDRRRRGETLKDKPATSEASSPRRSRRAVCARVARPWIKRGRSSCACSIPYLA